MLLTSVPKIKKKHSRYNLDTLAQLSTFEYKPLEDNQLLLKKRARAKAFTYSYLFDLIDIGSPLVKSYWNTYHCSNIILQEGSKITSKYCNNRWCLVCNRIRTAKIINGYKPEIDKFQEPQFTTLTRPNVKARDLRQELDYLNKCFRDITKSLKKTHKIQLQALRKIECTYNAKDNTYHPHIHTITEGKDTANLFLSYWLKKNPTASRKAQDIRQADDTSLVELCKYFTKVITKDNDYNPKAQDKIFQSMKNKRTFQPIGIKKYVSEDIEEIQAQTIDFKPPQDEIWSYDKEVFDWVSAYGETLSEYTPTKEDLKVINQEYK